MISQHERHRALAGATRLRLLDHLRRAPEPATVRELAAQMSLHENSVREQLDRLVAVGLVTRRASVPSGRGRPAVQYSSNIPIVDGREGGAFHKLALALADQLARGPDAVGAAAAAGIRWGRAVAEEMPKARDRRAAMRLVMTLLDEAGFAPEAPGTATDPIRLHRCPFGELAIERAGVICQLHLGMLEGVLEVIEAPLVATRLEPFAAPGVCFAFVEPRQSR